MLGLHQRPVVDTIDFMAATMVPKIPKDAVVYTSIL